MPQKSLSGLLPFAFSTAPLVLGSGTGADPLAQALLWYAVLGIMGVLSAASTVIAFLEFQDRRKERAERKVADSRAGSLGGYVTTDAMLNELKAVYRKIESTEQRLEEGIAADIGEIKKAIKELTTAFSGLNSRHERLEGRMEVYHPPVTGTKPRP